MTPTQALQFVPETQNSSWGFWGTMGQHAAAAWPLACHAIAAATAQSGDSVRSFLDSSHGRHFADGVTGRVAAGAEIEEAIAQETSRWMAWKIVRRVARATGLTIGMPYLTGFVVDSAARA